MGHINFWLTEALVDASKEVDLETNIEETKYMLLSHRKNVGQNRNKKYQTDRLKMCHSSNIWKG
jgi:hypothetical protein